MKSSYCHNKSSFPLDKIVPTVGLNVGKIITQGVKITLWDMGGQDALRYVTLITSRLVRITECNSFLLDGIVEKLKAYVAISRNLYFISFIHQS